MKGTLVKNLMDRLSEFGLSFDDPKAIADLQEREVAEVTLRHAQGRAQYVVGFSPELTGASLRWAQPHLSDAHRLLLIGPRVTERSAELFRQQRVDFIDQAGNAFISFEGVHVDVRGRRFKGTEPEGAGRRIATRGGVNLFSAKRSQLTMAILAWPEISGRPVRHLAQVAGVSVGQAQETLELLEEFHYLDGDRALVPDRSNLLLDQWAAAFPTGMGSPRRTGHFSGDIADLEYAGPAIYLSGEAAVPDLLRPETLVLYSNELPAGLIRARRWRRDAENPNILIRRQFWIPPTPDPGGLHHAPWPLVYADLLASNDSRQREAAERLRRDHARDLTR